MGIELTRLFVPLGPAELEHVVASNGLELPTSLAREHLVVSLGYAHAMALGCASATAADAGAASFVLRVEVVTGYLQRLEPRVLGRGSSVELWIPGAQIPGLNRRIARPIRVLHALDGPRYAGRALPGHSMFGDDIQLFLMILEQAPALRPIPLVRDAERWKERLRRLRRVRVGELRWMLAQERTWPLPGFGMLRRELESIGVEGFTEEWQRAAGVHTRGASRPESWEERLLEAARLWLVCNLAFWRATGRVGRTELVGLAERLQRSFPHPSPTLRATLLD